jgi:hypothetical protein
LLPSVACCNCEVLDDSANALFMTEIVRGMAYTIKAYFDPKVTVSSSHLTSSTLSAQQPQHAAEPALGYNELGSVQGVLAWLPFRQWQQGTGATFAAFSSNCKQAAG